MSRACGQSFGRRHHKNARHARSTGGRRAGWILLRSPSGEHRRRQRTKPGTDVSEARPNDGPSEPPTLATVQATWDVIAPNWRTYT